MARRRSRRSKRPYRIYDKDYRFMHDKVWDKLVDLSDDLIHVANKYHSEGLMREFNKLYSVSNKIMKAAEDLSTVVFDSVEPD